MRKKRNPMLIRFLVSYLLVLLFPLMIILMYYYPHSTAVVKKQHMDWNTHVTEQFMTSMNTFTRYVYNLPYELVQNREIKMYDNSDYQRVLNAGEMRKYNATDGFIYNTLLYIKSTGYLFAKTGSAYKAEDFNKPGIGYYYENWPYQEMIGTLNHLEAPIVRPVESVVIPGSNQVRMITFALPLPVGGYDPPGAVLIMVREDTMIRMMNSVSEKYTGQFFIFDAQGNELLASEETDYNGSTEFRGIVSGLKEGTEKAGIHSLNGRDYIVSHSVSDKNGWQYVSMLPVTDTLLGIQKIQRNSVMLIGLMLLLEMLIIYLSIRQNYQPIKRLVDFAIDIFEPADRKALNEIETIRYALGELVSVNSSLDAEVKRTLPIMRDNLLFELVSGKIPAWEDFQREAKAYGIKFAFPYSAVAVLSLEPEVTAEGAEEGSGNAVLDAADVLRSLEESRTEGMEGYIFKSIYNQEMIFVCSCEEQFPVKEYLDGVRRKVEADTGVRVFVGIGTPAKPFSAEDIHLSYLQAVRASEFLRLRRDDQVLVFNEMDIPKSGTVSYFAELLQSLELSILKNEVTAVKAVVEKIVGHMETGSGGASPHIVRSIYLNTVSVILSGLQRFSHDDAGLLRLTDAAFRHHYTIGQMVGIIRDSCSKLCDIIQSTLPSSNVVSRDDMIRYIEEKGMEPDFSLQRIAEYFHMSPSNFSHYFKKTIGQNFKEYIDMQRIQKSAQLLRNTSQTLEEVSRQTGFSNTSSFIRCFKKIVGTTPGQYREAHRAG